MSLLLALLLAVALPLTSLPLATGSVQRFNVPSATLGMSRTLRVYLPPSYARPESAHRRYPTVYLLHGWPGSDGNWFGLGHADESADTLIARGVVPEVILVCPNGSCGMLGRAMWMNAPSGRCRLEDYLVHDVVGWVDSTFRTEASPHGRAAVGLSDGGTAAFNLAFRHPDLFGACASMSADFVLHRNAIGIGSFVGSGPEADRLLAEHSPALTAVEHVAQLRTQRLVFDCGVDDDSIEQNRLMHETLERLGIPHVYAEYPGSHTWGYWRVHFQAALVAVTRGMS